MGKVKKAGAARNGARRRGVAKRPKSERTSKKRKPQSRPKSTKPVASPPVSSFTAQELDPVRKCGPGTSVRLLYRVDEQNGKVMQPHLVFLDRHGWYCEHGRSCPAVPHAQKAARKTHGSFVSSGVNARHTRQNGPTQNGRMRA